MKTVTKKYTVIDARNDGGFKSKRYNPRNIEVP